MKTKRLFDVREIVTDVREIVTKEWNEILEKEEAPFTQIPPLPEQALGITRALREGHCATDHEITNGEKKIYQTSEGYLRDHELLQNRDEVITGKKWNITFNLDTPKERETRIKKASNTVPTVKLQVTGVISETNPPRAELQATLAWRKMFEKLVNGDIFRASEFPKDLEGLISDWQENKALSGVFAKDIFVWQGLSESLSSQNNEMQNKSMTEFLAYYHNVSLKRTKKTKPDGSIITTQDPVNWRVAAAIAYAEQDENGENLTQICEQYKVTEKQEAVKILATGVRENGLFFLKDKNSRLVGRLMLLEYLRSRQDKTNKRRVNEVALMVLLRLPPYNKHYTDWLQKLSDDDLKGMITGAIDLN